MDLSHLTSVTLHDAVNDTQFCYHLVYPKYFNLIKKQKRPTQSGGPTAAKKRRRRGRPRKEEVKKSEEIRGTTEDNASEDKTNENVVQLACSRTRSGRVSRPPKHMSKFVDTRITLATEVNTIPLETAEPPSVFNIEQLAETAKPTKITAPEPRKVRKNIDRFKCGVCKKVYLGRKKLLKHYLVYPDHNTPGNLLGAPNNRLAIGNGGTNSLLFDELMKLVSRSTQTERISIFLTELSNFVSNINQFKPKIMYSGQTAHPSTSEYYIDKNVSKVLDITEGLHQLNDRAFDVHFQPNNNTFSTYIDDERPPPTVADTSSLDGISLQPLGCNLNLFPQVNYDQISDNAVEAEVLGKSNGNDTIVDLPHETPILDISLDLFSFNGIK